jgi:hypothetical protein
MHLSGSRTVGIRRDPNLTVGIPARAIPVRHLRLLLVLAVVVAVAGTGCQAIENDRILGSKPFQPNMNPQ